MLAKVIAVMQRWYDVGFDTDVRMIPYRNERSPRKHRTLDQSQVVRAALALLDEEGMDELTMRRLGERLGVKAPSLYRHVRDKADLLILLADEISGEIPLPRGVGEWRVQLTEMAWNVRRGLAAHRDAARSREHPARRIPAAAPHRGGARILPSAGLGRSDAVRAAHLCNNFVTEFAGDEARFAAMAAIPAGAKKMFAEARGYFRQCPPRSIRMSSSWPMN